jgi:hypothetical protein
MVLPDTRTGLLFKVPAPSRLESLPRHEAASGATVLIRPYNRAIFQRLEDVRKQLANGSITPQQAGREIAQLRLEARKTLRAEPNLLAMTKSDVAKAQATRNSAPGDRSERLQSGSGGVGLFDRIRRILGL